jgi:hypothetical protein
MGFRGSGVQISASRPPFNSQRRLRAALLSAATIALARARAHEHSAGAARPRALAPHLPRARAGIAGVGGWLPGGLNLRTLMEGVAATASLRFAVAATHPDQRVVVRRPPPSRRPPRLRPQGAAPGACRGSGVQISASRPCSMSGLSSLLPDDIDRDFHRRNRSPVLKPVCGVPILGPAHPRLIVRSDSIPMVSDRSL